MEGWRGLGECWKGWEGPSVVICQGCIGGESVGLGCRV